MRENLARRGIDLDDPVRRYWWTPRDCEVCERTVRGSRTTRHIVCSDECYADLRRTLRRRRREAEIPSEFVCAGCEKPIEGTVVFDYHDSYGRKESVYRCEPCFATKQTERDRELFARSAVMPGLLALVGPSPDDPSYTPFRGYAFDPRPCESCGRSIRRVGGVPWCSPRCQHEVEKARRRVQQTEVVCAVCEEPFTPKRADARYCSNACRQDAYRKRKLGALSPGVAGITNS